MIKISRLNSVSNLGKTKAFVDLIVDDGLVIKDIAISDGIKGLFIQWPSKKKSDGTYVDTVHPISLTFKDKITKFILDAYKSAEEESKLKVME